MTQKTAMTAAELDNAYSALAAAIDVVGEAHTPLLLSMVALALIAQHHDLTSVLGIIMQAQKDACT